MTETRVVAYAPNGVSLGPVPAPQSIQAAFLLSDVGALTLTYPPQGPRSDILGQPIELGTEVTYDQGATWAEPDGGRFLYLRDARDPVKDDAYQVECPSYVWRLSKALVPFTGLDGSGQRTFTGATPGAILDTLLDEAQARGALTGITWGFTPALDSAGTPWPKVWTISYAPGADMLAIVMGLAEQGLVDFTTRGRELRVYVAGSATGMGADRTTGANPVALRHGRDLTEAPFRRTWEGLADTAYVLGDDGATVVRTNASALRPWGRQEAFVTASGVDDPGTLTVLADANLTYTADPRTEHTYGLDFTQAIHLPLRDYKPGEWVYKAADGTQAPERVRVRQVTLVRDNDGHSAGNVVLNDRFLEADVRQARRIAAITGGATGSGTGGTPAPVPVGSDILAPAAPTGLTANAEPYITGKYANAQVTLDWADVTTNADATAATDIDHYEVHRRPGTVGAWEAFQEVDQSVAFSSGYTPGTTWQFRVRAVDTVFNRSGFSAIQEVEMPGDAVPPPAPSTPTATTSRATVTIDWDGLTYTGQDMAVVTPDLDRVEVHVGAPGFVPVAGAPATLYGSLGAAGSLATNALTTGTTYGVRLIAVDTTGNASALSAEDTVTVDDPDPAPVAPTAVPTPATLGGIRDLKVTWEPVANPSPTLTEVHLSTDPAFVAVAGDPATLAKTVGGTFTALDTDPAGDPLVPSTPYYVSLVSVNEAGAFGPSTRAEGTLRLLSSTDIAATAAWIGTLDAGRITTGEFTAELGVVGALEARGTNGERVGLSGTEGFYVIGPDPDNDLLVSFPTNGDRPNIISGKLTSSTLTVTEGATFRKATQIEPGATFVLAGKVEAPNGAPSLGVSWPRVALQMPADEDSWDGVFGLTKGHNGNYYYVSDSYNSSAVQEVAPNGAWVAEHLPTSWASSGPAGAMTMPSLRGIHYHPGNDTYYVLSEHVANGSFWVTAWTSAWALQATVKVLTKGADTDFLPAMGWDYAHGTQLLIGYHSKVANAVRIDSWAVGVGGLGAKVSTWTSGDSGYKNSLNYVAKGTFDLPGSRYVFQARYFDYRVHGVANGSSLNENETWPSAAGAESAGATWDFNQFKTLTRDGRNLYTFSGGEYYWTTTAGDYHHVAYSWYDGNVAGTGVHETALSPKAAVKHTKRAQVVVTADDVPLGDGGTDSPTSWRLYKTTSSTSAPPATLYQRADIPAGTNTKIITPGGDYIGGAHAAIPFPTVTNPGRITSASGLSWWAGDETTLNKVTTSRLVTPRAKMSKNASQSVANNADVVKQFQVADQANGVTVDLANNRFVILTDGFYVVTCQTRWAANGSGGRCTRILKNGATHASVNASASGVSAVPGSAAVQVTFEDEFVAGDYLTFQVLQNSGAALDMVLNFGGCWATVRQA